MSSHLDVTLLKVVKAGFQPRPVVAGAGRLILVQVAAVHSGGEKGVTLQVHRLPVFGGGHTHVADEHVRKTLDPGLPHSVAIRQGFSHSYGWV